MVPPPLSLVILGASGDLTHRLLLPGLGTLLRAKPDYRLHLVGAAADGMTVDTWRQRVEAALAEGGCRGSRAAEMAHEASFVHLDVTDREEMQNFIDGLAREGRQIVLYFALPPAVTQRAVTVLSTLALPPDIRLALEKPFGSNLASAKELNALLASFVPEERLFRVDHYLGKATVLNLLGLRFGNRIFEPVWNAQNIQRVEIIADESLALEGRAGYYDHAGALKDMIQSHLMLVMAIFAMEQPARIDAVELRDLIVHTLRSTRLWANDGEPSSRRARYTAGTVGGRAVPDYTAEPGVDPSRMTETLAQVTLEIHNARWAGVPFRLRSGKALGDGFRGIVVEFKQVAHLPEGFHDTAASNLLVIGFTPETLALRITTNAESRWDLESTTLAADLSESPVRPYGEILDEILTGNVLLGVRGDMAEESWRILEPLLQDWADGLVPMDTYRAGSYGPALWNQKNHSN